MHRECLIGKLQRYRPSSDYEKQCKKQMMEFICNNPDCFKRELLEGHITFSAWVLSPDFSRALMLHHKKLDKWLQPGGHADGEINPVEGALKEAREETGISRIKALSRSIFDIDIHEIPTYKETPAHLHYDVRILVQAQSNRCNKNSESNELCWALPEEVQLLTQEPSVLRMRDKWSKLLELSQLKKSA